MDNGTVPMAFVKRFTVKVKDSNEKPTKNSPSKNEVRLLQV
jgi:hypothetical protein